MERKKERRKVSKGQVPVHALHCNARKCVSGRWEDDRGTEGGGGEEEEETRRDDIETTAETTLGHMNDKPTEKKARRKKAQEMAERHVLDVERREPMEDPRTPRTQGKQTTSTKEKEKDKTWQTEMNKNKNNES
jgi:hypothetical protein